MADEFYFKKPLRERFPIILDEYGYIQIGRFKFSPKCEFISFDGRALKNPNKQTQILLRNLIEAYKRGFGLSPDVIKEFLYLDFYSANDNQPDTERIRDWVCNSFSSRTYWGPGKLIESMRSEVIFNPHWIPPETAFKKD